MSMNRITMIVAIAGLLWTPGLALAQSTTASPPSHVPVQKTIGQVSTPQVVPSLIVFNSQGASPCRATSWC
jgi:hypothetical protein